MNGGSGMEGRADSQGRVYQASGDQHITEHHHHGGSASSPSAQSSGIESVRRPTGGRAPVVFRDRTELMARLHAAVDAGRGGHVYVLHGMGGSGKTAVAHAVFQYATGVADRVGLWVNASDRATLRGGMLAVAADRGAEEGELLAARNGLRAAADLVWDRLDQSGHPWLLVLDNADDPAVLQDGWLRSSPRGTVLITTRQAAAHWWSDAELHHVDVLPSDAAAQVLCDLAPQTGTVEEARSVADRLGRLPLALTLAGGFLAHQVIEPWTMTKYEQHLDGPQGVELIDKGAAGASPLADSRNLVSRTWQLSLDALAEQGLPESTGLLRLLACYGADPLPLSLLSGLPDDGEPPRARAEAALRGLLDQSLTAMVDVGVRCVQTHGVLLASVAANTPAGQATSLAATACGLLDAVVPAVPERGPQNLLFRLLGPHALALLQGATDASVTANALDLAVRLAIAQHRTGDYLSAYELASSAAAVAEPELGPEHRLVLSAKSRTGRALFRLGRFDEAEALIRRVLADRERLFGPDDPDTLDSCYGLNSTLQQMGRGAEGLVLLRRSVSGRERVLGSAHPLTLHARSTLLTFLPAAELSAQLDSAALPLPEECGAVLGTDHGVTITARLNYAHSLHRLGRFAMADEGARAAAEDFERVFGPDYPITYSARTLYAKTRADRGDLAMAIDLMTDVVRGRSRSLGEQHPYTLTSREYLATFRSLMDRQVLD